MGVEGPEETHWDEESAAVYTGVHGEGRLGRAGPCLIITGRLTPPGVLLHYEVYPRRGDVAGTWIDRREWVAFGIAPRGRVLCDRVDLMNRLFGRVALNLTGSATAGPGATAGPPPETILLRNFSRRGAIG